MISLPYRDDSLDGTPLLCWTIFLDEESNGWAVVVEDLEAEHSGMDESPE